MTGEKARVFENCRVTPLIDAGRYAAELRAALDRVGRGADPEQNAGQLVLVAGWWLGLARGGFDVVPLGPIARAAGLVGARPRDEPPFCLDPWPDPDSTPFADPPDERSALIDVLIAKARAGVDVRVLGWVSNLNRYTRVFPRLSAPIAAINALTLRSIERLRAEPAIGARAQPNLAGHTAGSTHSKIFLVCDGSDTVAFTGGLDLEYTRWTGREHSGRQIWHDVVAKVQGPAAQSVYDHFKTLWDANRAPEALPERRLPIRTEPGFKHRVEALETLPAARYRRGTWMPRSTPFAGAPEGRFTYRDALRRAIAEARRYIYIEDQLHWSREVMDWLNAALRAQDDLEVLLLGSGVDDPHDPPLPHDAYLCQAVNHHLLRGLNAGQRDRVLMFRHRGVVVHAKTVIVDDRWAAIGSCNIGARSLYTDVEHGIGFTDAEGALIREYRADLWEHHLASGDRAKVTDLDSALRLWRKVSDQLDPVPLPLDEVPYPARMERRYRGIHDPDSREPWGGPIPHGVF